MPRILALFAIFMLGCSSTAFSAAGNAGVGTGAGAGGELEATGGSAGSVTATGGRSGSTSAAGATSMGGQGAGGSAAGGAGGAPAGSTHVDVVPGVVTDCVFPSDIVMPPLIPDVCQDIHGADVCMKCAGDCTLPFTFSNLVWDYSTLTLTFDVNNNSELYTMDQGSCSSGTLTSCTYKVAVGNPSDASVTMSVVFQKTDRGYVGWSVGNHPNLVPTSSGCSDSTTVEAGATSDCIHGGWTDYWYNLTIPCAN